MNNKKKCAKFFAVFSNDDIEFYIPVGHVWTEYGKNDLHLQFGDESNRPEWKPDYTSDNFWPRTNRQEHYEVKYRGKVYTCKGLHFVAKKPKEGRPLSRKVLETFWESPNR